MKNNKGMEREVVVGLIIAIIVIAVGAYLINKHILGTSIKLDRISSCEAQKGNICVKLKEDCATNNVFQTGCEDTPEKSWCCFKEQT